jgi:hypothetical protein
MSEGGGASRTTELAAGTSAATDVSLLEHVRVMFLAERELAESRRTSDQKLADAVRAGDVEAVRTAFAAQQELTKAHNGLLRRMELLVETFATKEAVDRRFSTVDEATDKRTDNFDERFKKIEAWQAKVTGAVGIVAAIGLTNFIKVWFP